MFPLFAPPTRLRALAPRSLGAVVLLLALLMAWGMGAVGLHSHPGHHSDLNCAVCRLIDQTQTTAPVTGLSAGHSTDDGQVAPSPGRPIPPEHFAPADCDLRAPPRV